MKTDDLAVEFRQFCGREKFRRFISELMNEKDSMFQILLIADFSEKSGSPEPSMAELQNAFQDEIQEAKVSAQQESVRAAAKAEAAKREQEEREIAKLWNRRDREWADTKRENRIFISYCKEDRGTARRLYLDLQLLGFSPWVDFQNIRPGANWRLSASAAIRQSQYFVLLLSSKMFERRGFIHKEVRDAFEFAEEIPPDEVFILPLRLDAIEPSMKKLADLHWIDLFPSYENGLRNLLRWLPTPPGSELNEHLFFEGYLNGELWYARIRTTPARIGRNPGCAVVISSRHVSAQHAELIQTEGDIVLYDLGSSNGTFVNDQRITTACALRSGDVVRFSGVRLLFTRTPIIANRRSNRSITWKADLDAADTVDEEVDVGESLPALEGAAREAGPALRLAEALGYSTVQEAIKSTEADPRDLEMTGGSCGTFAESS